MTSLQDYVFRPTSPKRGRAILRNVNRSQRRRIVRGEIKWQYYFIRYTLRADGVPVIYTAEQAVIDGVAWP